MALTTSPNLFGGEYVKGVNIAAIYSGDTVKSGLWRLEQGFEDKAIVKLMNYTSNLAAGTLCAATPTNSTSMADLEIALTTFSIYDKVCKHDFDNTNYALYQNRGVFNKQIPQEVLEAYILTLAQNETFNLERIRWSGDTTSVNPVLSLQDGVVAQLVAAGTAVAVAPTAAGDILDPATVIAELNKIIAATPANIRTQRGFKLVISSATYAAYQQAMAANQAYAMYALMGMNGVNEIRTEQPAYIGLFVGTSIPMYLAAGLDDTNSGEVALAGVFSNDLQGNLVFATDALSDQSFISVQDRQAVFASEPFVDITWSFRQGVGIARPAEVVLYI